MTSRIKPVVRWNGGKSRLLKNLLPLIRPHRLYAEAFGGGLALFLAKERAPVEVINDANGDLVALYRCAQFHMEALIGEVEFMLTSRQNLADLVEQPGLTELQRAARFLMRNRMSFGGSGDSYAVSKAHAQPSRANVLEGLRALNARLDKVSIENLSYERLFALYDAPDALWFLDPPYLNSKAAGYAGWDEAQMREFHQRTEALAGDFIVTVDDSPLNRELWAAHEVAPVATRNGCVNQRTHGGGTFGELVIRRRLARRVQRAAKASARRVQPGLTIAA
jgi:DNA adenine methylase